MNQSTNNEPKYINPYLGGVLLGLLVLITVYITGRGLGASGAIQKCGGYHCPGGYPGKG